MFFWYVVFRKEKGGDKISHSSLYNNIRQWSFSPSFSFPLSLLLWSSSLCCAPSPPTLPPPTKTIFLCQFPISSPPPPSPWACILHYMLVLAWADQFDQFYNRTQAGRLADTQKLCLFTRGKETEGGYCLDTKRLCITSPHTCKQKVVHAKWAYRFKCCTYITVSDTCVTDTSVTYCVSVSCKPAFPLKTLVHICNSVYALTCIDKHERYLFAL